MESSSTFCVLQIRPLLFAETYVTTSPTTYLLLTEESLVYLCRCENIKEWRNCMNLIVNSIVYKTFHFSQTVTLYLQCSIDAISRNNPKFDLTCGRFRFWCWKLWRNTKHLVWYKGRIILIQCGVEGCNVSELEVNDEPNQYVSTVYWLH
jgi:hypothetical protein